MCDEWGSFHADWRTYPPVAEVLALPLGAIPEWVGDSIGGKGMAPCEAFQHHSERLQLDAERYEDIRTRGEDALSRYDVEIAAGGCADAALNTAMSLKFNHIYYARLHLEYVRQNWPGVVPFAEQFIGEKHHAIAYQASQPSQLSLF